MVAGEPLHAGALTVTVVAVRNLAAARARASMFCCVSLDAAERTDTVHASAQPRMLRVPKAGGSIGVTFVEPSGVWRERRP